MLKVLIDTNTLFSGIGWTHSIPYHVIIAATDNTYKLVISPYIIQETRKKLIEKLKNPSPLADFESYLETVDYELVPDPIPEEIIQHLHLIPNDPKDVPIALTAIQAGVDVLVTGNTKDFFDRASDELHQAVKVMTPRQFYDTYLSQ